MSDGLPIFVRQPSALRYRIKAVDGTVYDGILGVDIRKTLERPAGVGRPVVVYEAKHPVSGLVVRLWPEDIVEVEGEPIP